ncbi:MAG TPA: hypothetical protein VMS31_00800, partial [Pyrinomonadaceae bacterium]|nr:hypothetical protein [Pyrinomonadaceae bacterium]
MGSLVRHRLIAIVLAPLVLAALLSRPTLDQTAQARNVSNRLTNNATPESREHREEAAYTSGSVIQGVAVGTPKVSPNSVNVYSQGATSVLLTFSGVINLQPMEASFCSELVPVFSGTDPIGASSGFKCKPGSNLGGLPQRYDQSTLSQNNTFTDILTVTPEIARRAYLNAVRGKGSNFFYVRRFLNRTTLREVGVPVTIRLSGNGVGVPLSLTQVTLKWGATARPIVFVKTGEVLPQVQAEITYTGTGRLKGRWELVKPGDILPGGRDLLTEGTMPLEERGTHRRYTEMSRFNVYLPPTGKILLPGPEVERMDQNLTGLYQILLRIEATEDPQAIVRTVPGPGPAGERALDAAPRKVPGGGVAGFSLPVIKYYVANGPATVPPATITSSNPLELSPEDQATLDTNQPVDFTWPPDNAVKYRLEVEDLQGAPLIAAILPAGVTSYRAPSWFKDRVGRKVVRWRVISFGQEGDEINKTEWRALR